MKKSAGIVMYNFDDGELKILLVHSGGPYWKNKQHSCWSIPKGEFKNNEVPLSAAQREFEEETSFSVDGDFIEMIPVYQKNKIVYPFAIEGKIDTTKIVSNELLLD